MSKGKVILVRGVSGSGKSHYVGELRSKYEKLTGSGPDFDICSADHFFMQMIPSVDLGKAPSRMEYVFDPTKLGQAHVYCFSRFLDAIKDGTSVVVVDNTFIHHWEMKNYVKAANFADYDVEYHEFRVETIDQLRMIAARNVHRVPAEVVAKMAMEFQPMACAYVIPIWDGSK